jgi:choline-sulfatase
MLGDHGLYTKSVPYEASVRVPLLVAGPGIEGGRASDALVELIDVNPTICDLSGLPAQSNLDARSLGPLLRGETTDHRAETVSAIRHFRCMRTDRYKYVENYNAIDELYDLENDPDELVNLAGSESALVQALARRLQARYLEGQWRR